MEIKNRIVAALALCGIFLQCLSLDSFLFKGEKLGSYRFDSYCAETECPDALDSLPPADPADIRRFSIRSGSDNIAAVILGKKRIFDGSDTIIVYFHGTGPHIDYYWPRIRLLYNTGYSVLAVDYRGYGVSTGRPTESGIYEDGQSVLRFARDSLGNPHIVVYAFSLGSLIGCEVTLKASTDQIFSLVLEAPIASIATLVDDGSYLDLPASYVTTYTGNNAERIRSISIPLLWLHGTKDETLNRESNGLPLWNNYQGREGYYLAVDGAGHKTVPQTIGYARYCSIVKDFIAGHAGDNSGLTRK